MSSLSLNPGLIVSRSTVPVPDPINSPLPAQSRTVDKSSESPDKNSLVTKDQYVLQKVPSKKRKASESLDGRVTKKGKEDKPFIIPRHYLKELFKRELLCVRERQFRIDKTDLPHTIVEWLQNEEVRVKDSKDRYSVVGFEDLKLKHTFTRKTNREKIFLAYNPSRQCHVLAKQVSLNHREIELEELGSSGNRITVNHMDEYRPHKLIAFEPTKRLSRENVKSSLKIFLQHFRVELSTEPEVFAYKFNQN